MKRACIVWLLLFCWASLACASSVVELRSDRSAKAEVSEDKAKQAYNVQIKFAPVTTLDKVSNDEMTLVLAQFFAEEALSELLKSPKAVDFSRIKPQILSRDKNSITIQFTIPLGKIGEYQEKDKSEKEELRKLYTSAGNSGESLLEDFRSTCFRDLRSAEVHFASKIKSEKDHTELRKQIQQAFGALREKVNNDDALFMSEKDELLTKISRVEKFLLRQLRKQVAATPPVPSLEVIEQQLNISGAVFSPEFQEFLVQDKILLEIGGCKVIENESGKRALIAVGVASVKEDTPKGRLRCKKIAEAEALAEMAKHQEVDVTYFGQRSKTTEIETKNGVETSRIKRSSSSRTTVRAEAYFEQVTTIGSWYSKDKQLFFVAKGCLVK